ncbi:Hypothetical protein NTJ_08877 [Nesidiocoris tenuis]|uniref:Uncharacterized protein n=1 Tax=Nesidiocoris tenuis TaxID=355587 RepID=A0ABN7AVU3_9HEMI|nr:Hypothetical protein NTJ_08877 [Nesidiocoris tenuis]
MSADALLPHHHHHHLLHDPATNLLGLGRYPRHPLISPDQLLAAAHGGLPHHDHHTLGLLGHHDHHTLGLLGHHDHHPLARHHRSNQLDSRHYIDMFMHEQDGVSPLDIPLDSSYTHHPNRWEWGV